MAPTLVQSKSGNQSANNPTLAFTSNVQAGNLIVAAWVQKTAVGGATPTISGTATIGSWTTFSSSTGTGFGVGAYMVNVITGGTCTVNMTTTAASAYLIQEWSGLQNIRDLGVRNTNSNLTTPQVQMSGSSVNNQDLLWACVFSAMNVAYTKDTNYTADPNGAIASANGSLKAEYQIVSTTGQYVATWTQPSSIEYIACIAPIEQVASLLRFRPPILQAVKRASFY